MEGKKRQGSRLAYIDNLRALMIIFVVMIHTAVTYSGFGSGFMWKIKVLILYHHTFLDFFNRLPRHILCHCCLCLQGIAFLEVSLCKDIAS